MYYISSDINNDEYCVYDLMYLCIYYNYNVNIINIIKRISFVRKLDCNVHTHPERLDEQEWHGDHRLAGFSEQLHHLVGETVKTKTDNTVVDLD